MDEAKVRGACGASKSGSPLCFLGGKYASSAYTLPWCLIWKGAAIGKLLHIGLQVVFGHNPIYVRDKSAPLMRVASSKLKYAVY